MPAWGDDPELLATFRAEVEERLASLQAGLLELEGAGAPRPVVQRLFRDAHTVKGSARMLGLTGVLSVAHGMEDLLGLLRDGRVAVRRDLVDLLLASSDGIARALPGITVVADQGARERQYRFPVRFRISDSTPAEEAALNACIDRYPQLVRGVLTERDR